MRGVLLNIKWGINFKILIALLRLIKSSSYKKNYDEIHGCACGNVCPTSMHAQACMHVAICMSTQKVFLTNRM